MSWPDGKRYSGQFWDGHPHGIGEFQMPNGLKRLSEWEHGFLAKWL